MIHSFRLTFFLNVQTASGYTEQYSIYPLKFHNHFKICMCWITYLSYIDSRSLFLKSKISFISSAKVLMTLADVPHTRSAGNARRSSSVGPHVLAKVCSICVPSLCCKGFRCHPHNTHNRAVYQHGKTRSLFAHCSPEPPAAVWKVHLQKKQSNWNYKMLKKYLKLKYFRTKKAL